MPGSLPNQNRRHLIKLSCQVTVGAGTKQRCRQRVGIHQLEVFGLQFDLTLLLLEVLGIQQEGSEVRLGAGADRKDRKFVTAVNAGENSLSVFEIIQRAQSVPCDQIAEEGYCPK